jgi:hypothetical protein
LPWTGELSRPAGHILGIEEVLCGPIVPGFPGLPGKIDLLVETANELVVTSALHCDCDPTSDLRA